MSDVIFTSRIPKSLGALADLRAAEIGVTRSWYLRLLVESDVNGRASEERNTHDPLSRNGAHGNGNDGRPPPQDAA